MNTQRLHSLIAAAAPIHGVALGDPADKSTWRIDFKDEATGAQRAAALAALASFADVRERLTSDLFSVLQDSEWAAIEGKARKADLRILTARGMDMLPETNSKLKRVAAAAGITPAQWFDRL